MRLLPLSSRAKKSVEPVAPPSLSSILLDEAVTSKPVLLRPATATQKSLMIEGVIRSRREMWAEGGYVFVGRQDASGVAQALAENGIEYLICSIANTHEHGLLWPLSHVLDAKHVIVYVDDESLTFSKRTDHYRRFLSKVIDQCRKWDDEPVSSSWRFLPVFYIDINLPSISSFAHRMAQASKQFGTFELSSKNAFDREVDQGMAFGREPEELKTLMASSVCIYGAGKRNSAEIVSAHRLSAMQPAPEDEYRWIQTLGDLRQESNLAWVGHQTEPKVVDLSL